MEQRQFRPVFEDIDAGRPASALDKLLILPKKAPKIAINPTFLALKCLCHQRLGQEDQAIEAFETLLKDDQEKKPSAGSGSKGKAAARGKGGRQALLKKIQKVQSSEPVEPDEVEEKPVDTPQEAVAPAGKVFDDGVINVLQFALRGLGKHQELRKIYLDAWNADNRKDLEKGAQAFLCSLRCRDWADMQQTALLLLKYSQDPKMAHWAAMSLYLQATDRETAAETKPLLLSLAYNLLTIMPASPYRTPDVFILWVRLCRFAGLTHKSNPTLARGPATRDGSAMEKEALEVLTPDLRKAEKDVEFEAGWWTAVAGDLRIKWERWEMVGEIAERLIAGEDVEQPVQLANDVSDMDEEDVPDADEDVAQGTNPAGEEVSWLEHWDWEKEWERGDDQIRGAADLPETNYKAYLTHLSVLFLLLSKPEVIKDSAKSPATYLTETRRTLLDLASQPAFVKKERAPLVALLAINKRLDTLGLSINDVTGEEAGTAAILKRYLEEFGHKGCVKDDLLHYLHTREGTVDGELKSMLEVMVTETSSDYKGYMRNQNARKLLRRAMPPGDREAEIQDGKAFLEQYFAGAPYGKDLPITDVRPADDFGLMAAQAWISAWRLDKAAKDSRTLLALAAATLERVLKDSPANGQVRMLLIRVYRLIGTPSLIVEHIAPLKMRTFQQDTALHFVTERSTPDYVAGGEKTRTALASLLLQCKQVYERTQSDVSETSVAAFTEEAYSQISSMLELGDKFQHSHQRQLTELELVRHSAMRDSSELLGTDRSVAVQNLHLFDKETAIDVRDWDLFPDFGSAQADQTLIEQTQLGKLSTPLTVRGSADLWSAVLDPTSEKKPDIGVGTDLSHSDRIALDTGLAIVQLAEACRSGAPADISEISESLKTLAKPSANENGRQSMERAATLMECFAMLEIALTPYKVKTGKKGKGAAPSTVPQPVAEAVRAVLASAQDTIRAYASDFKSTEAADVLVGQNHLIDLSKALGLSEAMTASDLRRTEQAVRESRQLATKEIYRELKRRSDG